MPPTPPPGFFPENPALVQPPQMRSAIPPPPPGFMPESAMPPLPDATTMEPPTAPPSPYEGLPEDDSEDQPSAPQPEIPAPPPGFFPEEAPGVGSYVEASGKAFAKGVTGQLGAAPKEFVATNYDTARRQLAAMDKLDAGIPLAPGEALDRPYADFDAEGRRRMRERAKAMLATPIGEQPIYKFGQQIEESGKFQMPKGFEGQTWTTDLSAGAGSMIAGMGLALIPFVGSEVAGATFLLGGRQEARERAQQAGQSPEMQARAAELGTVAGATDLMDIVILKTGTLGNAVGLIRKIGLKAIESAFIEGAQEGVQELIQNSIEKGLYNPKKDVFEGVPRSAAIGFILGGAAGGAIGTAQEKFSGKPKENQTPMSEDAMARAFTLLTGKEPDLAPPPTVQPGFVRIYDGWDTENFTGNYNTTLDPDVAKNWQKEGQHVGWVDIPETDPAAKSLQLTPEQRGALTPMSTLEQQLQSASVLGIAQNNQLNFPEPQYGRGNVAEALGGPEVPGRPPIAAEQDASNFKASPGQVLTTPEGQSVLRQRVNELLVLREQNNRATEDLLNVKNKTPQQLSQMGPTLRHLEREGILINNELRQLWGAERGGTDQEPLPAKFTKINDDLWVDPRIVAKAKGQKIGDPKSTVEANTIGMAVAVQRIAQKFGIRSKIRFEIHKSTGEDFFGEALNLSNGRFRIRLDLDAIVKDNPNNTILKVQSTLMHELGHILMYERWSNASVEQKKLIQAAYDEFLESMDPLHSTRAELYIRRFNAVNTFNLFEKSQSFQGTRLQSFDISGKQYHLGFSEWFAEQVARWGTTNERPLNVVEQYFKNIALSLQKLFAALATKLTGTKFEGEQFRASGVMEEWLNHFIDHAPELSQDIYTEMQLKEIEQYGKLLPGGVPPVPLTPGMATTLATVKKAIPAGTPIPPTAQPPQMPPPPPPTPPAGPGGAQPGGPAQAAATAMAVHASRMNGLYKYTAGLSQLVTANPLFTPLLRYYEKVRQAHVTESAIHDAAGRIAKAWRKLGRQSENLTALIDDITNMRYRTPQEVAAGVTRHPTRIEFNNLVQQHGLSQEALAVFNQVKQSFAVFLRLNHQEAINTASRELANDPNALLQEIQRINGEFRAMASRPYFPFMRFGAYYVMVKDANGHTTHFSTYERIGLKSAQRVQAAAEAKIRAQAQPGEVVTTGKLPEEVMPFMGMPSSMLRSIETKMTLTPAQKDALKQLILAASPAMSFKHQLQRKDYTPGYSMDFRRAYARYFFHGARFYSKILYGWQMEDLLKQARGHGNVGDRIADFMDNHYQKAIIDVRGDFGLIKGAMFTWAMGYAPAAATQNLTQIPMIAFPYMAAKFGDFRAGRALLSSMKQLDNYYKKGNLVESLKQFQQGNISADFFVAALGYGVKAGRITEAQASDLAGMAGGGNLVAGIGGNKFERGFVHFQEKAAWMFEMAEQFNRRVVYRAALKLALERPNAKGVREAIARYNEEYLHLQNVEGFSQAQAAAIVTASYMVDQTQFVYARYDRPKLMRGPIGGTVLIFQRYLQSVLFLLAQNPKDVLPRYLLVAAAIGGMSGIPGYEDVRELIKAFAARWFGKHFNLDHEIKKYVLHILGGKVDPDLVLHGFARKGFGVPALLDLVGSYATGTPGRGLDSAVFHSRNIPAPLFDRTRALTSGHILPFELGKLFYPQKDMNSAIAEQTQKATGALWSVGFNMYKMIMDSKLNWSDPKRWERAIPREAASIVSTARMAFEGRERARAPADAASTAVKFDWTDTEHAMELVGNAMGYRPLRLAQHWDYVSAKKETEGFHDFMKERMLGQLFEAVRGRNQEEVKSVNEEIQKYNKSLRDNGLPGRQITKDTVVQSMQKRTKELLSRELDIPTKRSNIGIHQEMNKLFPHEVDRRPVGR